MLLSELRNVVVGLLRRGDLQPAEAVQICEDAESVLGDRIASVPSPTVLDAAVESGLSACDAEFVVLARHRTLPLVTAVRKILEGAPDVAREL